MTATATAGPTVQDHARAAVSMMTPALVREFAGEMGFDEGDLAAPGFTLATVLTHQAAGVDAKTAVAAVREVVLSKAQALLKDDALVRALQAEAVRRGRENAS